MLSPSSCELKLNLGAGAFPLDGYENLDHKTNQEIYPLPFASGTVAEVRASHVLEHFRQSEVQAVVKEWARVLKPGGWLKLAVPDFAWIANYYLKGGRRYVQQFTMGGQTDEDDFHKTIFDETSLTGLLQRAGLVEVQPWAAEIEDCSSLDVSLNLMAKKPDADSV